MRNGWVVRSRHRHGKGALPPLQGNPPHPHDVLPVLRTAPDRAGRPSRHERCSDQAARTTGRSKQPVAIEPGAAVRRPATACTADALAPAEGSVPQPFVSPTPPTAGQLPRHPAANGHPDRTAPLGQPRTLPVAYVLLGAAGLFALAGIAALILILTGSPPFSHTQRPSPSTTDPANSVSAPAPLSTPRPAPPKAASPEPSPVTAPLPFPLPPRPYAEPARPSFDCAKARLAVEILICNDVELAALDRVMAEKYRVLRETMSSEGRQQLKKDQLSWLAQRNACASRTDAQRCVKDRYFTRIADLQGG